MARLRSSAATRLTRNAVPPPGIGTPGFSTASVTTRTLPASHRHRRLDRRRRVVAFDGDVVVADTEDVAHVGVQLKRRQRTRRARQLLARMIVVVRVAVRVGTRMTELAEAQPCQMRGSEESRVEKKWVET